MYPKQQTWPLIFVSLARVLPSAPTLVLYELPKPEKRLTLAKPDLPIIMCVS